MLELEEKLYKKIIENIFIPKKINHNYLKEKIRDFLNRQIYYYQDLFKKVLPNEMIFVGLMESIHSNKYKNIYYKNGNFLVDDIDCIDREIQSTKININTSKMLAYNFPSDKVFTLFNTTNLEYKTFSSLNVANDFIMQGFIYLTVGNSCPSFYVGEKGLLIGHNNSNKYKKVGSIITDSWTIFTIEEDLLIKKMKDAGFSEEEIKNEIESAEFSYDLNQVFMK